MAISEEIRNAIRERCRFACAYCGVREIDVGSELEIDHFQPISRGGTNDLDNLLYACSACNRNKAAYWPLPDAPSHMHLLDPLADDLSAPIRLVEDGRLVGLTSRGSFHVDWLHLNRSQLVVMRQRQALNDRTQLLIIEMQQINHKLQETITQQEQELEILRERVRRLTRGDL